MSKGVDVVKGIYEAFGKGDVAAVLGAFDAAIELAGGRQLPLRRRQSVHRPAGGGRRACFSASSPTRTASTSRSRTSSMAATRSWPQGRYRGTMKKTGTPIDAQFAHVWHVRDGKVIRFQQYTDTRQWAQAAGV